MVGGRRKGTWQLYAETHDIEKPGSCTPEEKKEKVDIDSLGNEERVVVKDVALFKRTQPLLPNYC